MEGTVSFRITIVPSLKQIACVKIVLVLFQQEEVIELMRAYFRKSKFIPIRTQKLCFKHLFKKVAKTFDRYILDVYIKLQALSYGSFMYTELLSWLSYHCKFISPQLAICLIENINLIRWTTMGRINYHDTGVMLINHVKFDLITKYLLACINFIPEEVKRLAPKLANPILVYKLVPKKLSHYIFFWHQKLEGRNDEINAAIKKYCEDNNLESISSKDYYNLTIKDEAYYQYRWSKWTKKERDATLCTLADEKSPYLLHYIFKVDCIAREFLLLSMSPEFMKNMTENIVNIEYYEILLRRRCQSLRPEEYWFLFKKLNEELLSSFENYNTWDLYRCGIYLTMIWNHSDDAQKSYVIDQFKKGFSGLLYRLQRHSNFLMRITYLFSTREQLRRILFSAYGVWICMRMVKKGDIKLLFLIISKCSLSSEQINDLEEKFVILCGISLQFLKKRQLGETADFSI